MKENISEWGQFNGSSLFKIIRAFHRIFFVCVPKMLHSRPSYIYLCCSHSSTTLCSTVQTKPQSHTLAVIISSYYKWSEPGRLQASLYPNSSVAWPFCLFPDNTAWILTRRGGWSQQDQTVFYLPILVSDGEQPVQTSTSTLTVRVCSCDQEGNVMSCNAEAYSLPASLSRGALIAILACIFVLLGELWPAAVRMCREEPRACCPIMIFNLKQCQPEFHVTALI